MEFERMDIIRASSSFAENMGGDLDGGFRNIQV
jgi:hypothetical protein